MKTIAVIPVFGRIPLVKHTVERLYKKNGVDLVICVGQTEPERIACEKSEAVFIKHPNKPLGAKWNHGFKLAKQYKPDSVLFVGSSDWLSENWLPKLNPHLKDYAMVGKPDCYLLDINYRKKIYRACHWPGYICERKGEPIGIGRLLSADIMDKMNWEPFLDRMDGSLDFVMMRKIEAAGGKIKLLKDDSVKSMAISTDQWPQKHRFEDHWLQRMPSKIISEPKELMDEFPESYHIFK